MFTLDDNSIYVTRGDAVFFSVSAEDNGVPYKFQPGDVLRMKVFGKKAAEKVYLQKDFPVTEVCEKVAIELTEEDTKIGDVLSKPVDYWYEIELNPGENPQTIVGYHEDGPAVFRLYPEGADADTYEPDPEDFPVVDEELDMTSPRPVANKAVAKAVAQMKELCEDAVDAVAEKFVTPQMFGAIGDGEADDTEAFVAALASGCPVFVPAGVYCLGTVEIPAYGCLCGASAGGVVIKKTTEGAVLKVGGWAEVGNLSISGTGSATGVELNGGRAYVHDVTIQKCADGIVNNGVSSNLSRICRVTILDCERGIYLGNKNGSNSQSLSFYDIDIRGCHYGLVTEQPGNKFYNFCVQKGISGGCAIVLNAGANNNEFVGTYLENAEYASEVDFTTAQYNHFTGGRPLQYGNSFVNNDGTNIVLTRSIQYNAMFERGTVISECCGVIAKETDHGLPSAVLVAKNNGDNKVLVQTLGTSVPTEVDFSNMAVREDNLTHVMGSRKFKGFGMLSYTPKFPNFANGELASVFTSTIGAADLVFVQCTTPRVHAWIEKAEGGQHKITAKNESGDDLSGVQLTFVIMFATTA